MFLNTSGRVLYDGILFNSALTQEGGYLLDCDTSLAEKILKHLKMYKLRKKVKLQILPDYETWVVFDTDPFMSESSEHSKDNPDNSAMAKDFKELDILKGKAGQDMADTKTHCTLDPRVKSLGFRLLAPTSAPELCYQLREMDGPHSYANLRYRLGVPEGAAEIESSKALPLEYNVEYAHGVSFHKGCYIGQELTARTHHTGVIRKRVMPIRFTQKRESPVEGGESIVNEAGKALGKFIAGDKTHGIGMMRLEECSKAEEVRLKSDPETTLEPVERPNWWPKQSPKKTSARLKQYPKSLTIHTD